MKIIFDVDGVLTPKEWSANINLKLTQAEIKQRILDAKPSKEGFAMLETFINGFCNLYHNHRESVYQYIRFLTGRKKSEYYAATKNMFIQMNMDNILQIDKLMDCFIWYPESNGYDKPTYFNWKLQELMDLYDTGLYIDDDKDLVEFINSKKIVIQAIHFEARE